MSDFLFISPNERGIPRSIAVVSQSVQSGVPGYHNVTELHHNAATRSAIDQALAQADFVFYFGHGQTDYLGKSGTRLVDDQNLDADKVVVAIACHSGAGLGPAVFDSAAQGAFLGFVGPLGHPRRNVSRANHAYESALLRFLSQGTVNHLMSDLKAELLAAANDYLGTRHPDSLFSFMALRSNTVGLSISGNGNAYVP
ncbi:MAG: C25 family cysteine peptidase [Mycobacterium sp.]